jgi:heme A synthase
VHRWLGVALIGLFVHLAIASRRTPVATAATITALLAVLQATFGIVTVLSQLDPPVRALHAAIGYALWGALVWTSARAGCWRDALSEPIARRPGTVEVARAS